MTDISSKGLTPVETHAALRGEVVRLQEFAEKVQIERDELRAEVERGANRRRVVEGELTECSEGAMELRAENERLKAARDMVAEEREAWKKEAIFLRVGLRETVEAGEAWKAQVERLRAREETAKAALAGDQKLIDQLQAAQTALLEQNERFAVVIGELRALIDKHNDECRECPVIDA